MRGLLVLLPLVVVAACGTAPRTATGVLTGGIVFNGRLPPGYAQSGYQRGLVQIVSRGVVIRTARMRQGQRYRFDLRPGRYTVRTRGNAPPQMHQFCTRTVRIRAGHTLRANVYCVFH